MRRNDCDIGLENSAECVPAVLATVDIIEFHTIETQSSLDLTSDR